jgi:hypothetical protein
LARHLIEVQTYRGWAKRRNEGVFSGAKRSRVAADDAAREQGGVGASVYVHLDPDRELPQKSAEERVAA